MKTMKDGPYLLVMKDADYGIPYTLKNCTNPDGSTFVILAGVDGVKLLSNLEPGYRLIPLVPQADLIVPFDIDSEEKESLFKMAARRRQVLSEGGCCTYLIGAEDGRTDPWILCLCCGHDSFNADDIANLYCGFCRQYHSEWASLDFLS